MTIKLHDKRINADNYTTTISIGEYLEAVKDIITSNEFQRKRVRNSTTVYSLLKKDIIEGCVIPPIVLAYLGKEVVNEKELTTFLKTHSKDLIILDGLQRTYTLFDAVEELKAGIELFNPNRLDEFLKRENRIEFYAGINRIGILYRMLTLNTGQTQMTLRQQVEMLYSDYSKQDINGIKFIKETDTGCLPTLGNYNFKDIIDGFNSYLERNELPIDRFDVLENIQNLKNLSIENQTADLFAGFVSAYDSFLKTIIKLAPDVNLDEEEIGFDGMPFGRTPLSIFNKSQAMSGFGAALGHLKDSETIANFGEAIAIIPKIQISQDPTQALIELLTRLEEIRLTSKKIGNAQRMYFQYLFRALFNCESPAYLSLDKSIVDAYQKYRSQVL